MGGDVSRRKKRKVISKSIASGRRTDKLDDASDDQDAMILGAILCVHGEIEALRAS